MSVKAARLLTVGATTGALLLSGLGAAVAAPSGGAPDVIEVAKFAQVDATESLGSEPAGSGGEQVGGIVLSSEFKRSKKQGASPLRRNPGAGEVAPLAPGGGTPTSSGKRAKSNPQVQLAFEGLNHRDSRLADDGNAFSGEPADQGVCAGNGYILETVNSAVRVFDARTGVPVSQTLSLNEFYGFEPAIIRPNGPFGPFTFDISCHYDPDSNRWFHLAVDLDQDPATGDFTGDNYLDLAVSTSGDPTGAWNVCTASPA
jgi:hypothetical protein